jgi:hypothetical protein
MNYSSRRKNLLHFLSEISKFDVPIHLSTLNCDEKNLNLSSPNLTLYAEKGHDALWQKEALINKTVQRLPAAVKYVVLCDSDIVFTNKNWTQESLRKLDSCDIVQPFSHVIRMSEGERAPSKVGGFGRMENRRYLSYAYGQNSKFSGFLDQKLSLGTKGYCWVLKRSVFDKTGLYDKLIVGGGDELNLLGLTHNLSESDLTQFSDALRQDILNWYTSLKSNSRGCELGYVAGDIYHLWHGEIHRRRYDSRYQRSGIQHYNPTKDVSYKDGLLTFNKGEGSIRDYCSEYFRSRREDQVQKISFTRSISQMKDLLYRTIN